MELQHYGNPESQQYIYVLADPRTRQIRYVGRTVDYTVRYRQHTDLTANQGNTSREKWLRSLLEESVCPIMTVIAEYPNVQSVAAAECEYIRYFLKQGCDLVNYQADLLGFAA